MGKVSAYLIDIKAKELGHGPPGGEFVCVPAVDPKYYSPYRYDASQRLTENLKAINSSLV